MFFKYTVILIFCLVNISSLAQDYIVLSGKVLKQNSNDPIPFVHISLKGSSLGTISNISGEFQFKIPQAHKGGAVGFSSIGYEPLFVKVNKLGTIYLIPSQIMLKEVVITPRSASDIVKDAIKSIPKNYPSISTQSLGFYREEVKNAKGEHLYLSEGLLQVRKESYRNKHQRGHINIMKGRSKAFSLLDSLNVRFYAGAHIAHRFDFVMRRKDFLSLQKMNAFFYKQIGETTYGGNAVNIILFWPKNKFTGNYKGKMYIEAETGAFLSFECKATQHYINSMNIMQRGYWKEREYKVYYRKVNGKWHLNNVWQKGIFDKGKPLGNINYVTEFVATKFDSTAINPIKYVDRLHYQDIFLHKVDTLQTEFWGSNNIIQESYSMDKLSRAESSNKNLYQWLFKNGARISINYAMLAMPISVTALNIHFSYLDSYSSFEKRKEIKDVTTLIFHSGISYQIKKNINIRIRNSGDIFGKYKWSETIISISFQYSLSNENKRPIYIQPTLGISHYIISLPLGKFDNTENNLEIGTKNFDANKIQIDLRTKNLGIKSAVSLLYEINPKLLLSVEVGRYKSIKNSSIVKFKEKSGFFLTRKSASLSFKDENLTIKADGLVISNLPLHYNKFLSVGIVKKLF